MERYLENFSWNCPQVNATRYHMRLVNIGSSNGLLSSFSKPFRDSNLVSQRPIHTHDMANPQLSYDTVSTNPRISLCTIGAQCSTVLSNIYKYLGFHRCYEYFITGLCYGATPNRRQASAWTNDGPVPRRMHGSPSLEWRLMSAMASRFTNLVIVYSSVYSGADQRKHQSSASLAFVRGIHWWPVNSPHKGPVTRKMFPFDDVIMMPQW